MTSQPIPANEMERIVALSDFLLLLEVSFEQVSFWNAINSIMLIIFHMDMRQLMLLIIKIKHINDQSLKRDITGI